MHRIVIVGNSGSGKSTLAMQRRAELGIPSLDLDTITWEPDRPGVRLDPRESERRLDAFMEANEAWIVEGCYGDLIERAAARATELLFMNPGVEACVANNQRRPWEPHKYASPAEQEAHFDFLQRWVRDYYQREDEFSYARHRALFERFAGQKRELR